MNQRKNTRLVNYDYASSGAYFVTLVSRLRAPLFGYITHETLTPSPVGIIVEQEWLLLSTRIPLLRLDKFTVMPNHFHGILWLKPDNTLPLSRIISSYKAGVSRLCHQSIWQYNFHERVIRNERELFYTRQYIEQNPLRWHVDPYFTSAPNCENAQ